MAVPLNRPWQAPHTCGVCEGGDDVSWYCQNCEGSLCTDCKINHQSKPISKKHRIVSIIEGLRQRSQKQEPCASHPSLQFSLHCEDCKILVCTECVAKSHSGHRLGSITDAMEKVREEIEEFSDSLQSILTLKCGPEEEYWKGHITKCNDWYTWIETEVNRSRSEIIAEVNRVCDQLLYKAQGEKEERIKKTNNMQMTAQQKRRNIEKQIEKAKEVHTMTNSEILKFNKEKQSTTSTGKSTLDPLRLPRFVPGQRPTSQISEQIGVLEDEEVTVPNIFDSRFQMIHSFAEESERVYSIQTVSATEAWISSVNTNNIKFADSRNNKVNTTKTATKLLSFVVTYTGDIIVTDRDSKCVTILTQKGTISKVHKTNPLEPTGVCLTNDGQGIVVCMNTEDRSGSALRVYRLRPMEIIQTINYTDKPVGDFYSQRVIVNLTGDFWIAHQGQHKVYTIGPVGTLKSTYNGSTVTKGKRKFTPVDLCHDTYSNVLVTDCHNRAIHILDKDGDVLRYVQEELSGIGHIRGIDIDMEGKLWVGHGEGGLSIFKILN